MVGGRAREIGEAGASAHAGDKQPAFLVLPRPQSRDDELETRSSLVRLSSVPVSQHAGSRSQGDHRLIVLLLGCARSKRLVVASGLGPTRTA